MSYRVVTIVKCHLMIRLRELCGDRSRLWNAFVTALAFVALLYTVSDRIFSSAHPGAFDELAFRMLLHSILML